MHEISFAKSILDLSLETLGDRKKKILKLNIVAGVFSGIDESCLTFAFGMVSTETYAEGAIIEIKREPVRMICRKCGNSREFYKPDDFDRICENCGGDNKIEGGNGVYLDSMEIDE